MLLKIDKPFNGTYIKAIEIESLWRDSDVYGIQLVNSVVTISGWGATEVGSVKQSNDLMRIDMLIGELDRRMLQLTNKPGHHSCVGDSGGILINIFSKNLKIVLFYTFYIEFIPVFSPIKLIVNHLF